MLQTTLVLDPSSIKADTAVNAKGGTATVAGDKLLIAIGGITGAEPDWSGYSNLDWTRVGYWSTGGVWDYDMSPFGHTRHRGVFVIGYETPASAMPASGSATYTGNAQGVWYFPVAQGSGVAPCNCDEVRIVGNASFTADFGARTVGGSLTNMTFGDPAGAWQGGIAAWNDVGFSSTIAGNAFSGSTWVITTPPGAMLPNATGTVSGKFFGPSAQEAGAVWTLYDGTNAVIGTLTGKRP